MSAYIRVASANQNITVPQYFQQSVVSATQKNVWYMDGNLGLGQPVPTSKLVVDGSTSIGYPTTAAPTNGLIVSGNVGIGVANPDVKLHVVGGIKATGILNLPLAINYANGIKFGNAETTYTDDNLYQITFGANSTSIGLYSAGKGVFGRQGVGFHLSYNEEFSIKSSGWDNLFGIEGGTGKTFVKGYVGIGNTSPQFPLDVNGQVGLTNMTATYFFYNTPLVSGTTQSHGISIRANAGIWTQFGSIISSSDTRIKTNIQDISDETALAQLRLLQPKTYEYIDKVQRGSDPVIGFIAQEVAEVLPRAVTKQKEIIPSIYAIAAVSDGVLTLEKEHGLIVGDKVKLIKEQGGELITTVKEVLSTMSFTVDDTIEDARIFVYGKEVPDFHTLDKNAIFTIGVAAVQELDRQVQDHKSRIEALEQKLNQLLNSA